ncbi:ribosomal protein S6 kinase delta-1 isoform X2 [Anthonomus grandis grandis]|uniref:ribosomal protein S6 kinase delta-1 isoform X2 n=1 Tax=Anthonomus grandis grandis TaxID=2921223 RepID=UPI002166AF8C|nr:ribosomal protein S6 kinase delta-1 isoform X2 [Anthonomus grandis grandis]
MNLNSPIDSWVSWVRMFDIPEVSKHKDGFTLYKVVSFLYPEACPDAVTKLIVWKRFNDFKKLHKEIKLLQKKCNIKEDLPSLPKSVLFKRYDEETINQRKRGILNFLEYIGKHSSLFTSPVFINFFGSSLTPVDHLNSNINAIRANLNLPEEPELYNISDNEQSDTDSFTSSTVSTSKTSLKKPNSMTSINSQCSKTSDQISISNVDNSLLLLEEQNSPVKPSLSSESTQYLINASMHVNMAIELENDKSYEEAFAAYKTAVDILISGGKDDPDYDRRQMVRYKTEKYLIRAERIYNMYLAPEVKELQLQQQEPVQKPNVMKGPLYNLYKYKVIKIISSTGMLALHSEQQQLYYIKVIHKTVQFLNTHLILPENVPYMVKLVNHYNSDNALFLVLEFCSGTKLRDLLQNKSVTTEKDEELLRKIHDQSDNESELSFSDLLSDYASNRGSKSTPTKKTNTNDFDSGSFEKIDMSDVLPDKNVPKNIIDQPIEDIGTNDLLSQSKTGEEGTKASPMRHSIGRTLSDVSSFESCDEFEGRSTISEAVIVKWCSQLLIALDKLHCLGVICRDLSINNLLIDENDNLVLTYMCNVKELCDLYSRGLNLDLAPEVYSFEDITEAVDWWSFGAILYELLVGIPLSRVHTSINSYTHLIIPKYVSIEGKSLLKQLLIYEPQERLGSKSNGIQHLKSHPFFRSVNWSLAESRC